MAELIAVLCAATWIVLLSLRVAGQLGPRRGYSPGVPLRRDQPEPESELTGPSPSTLAPVRVPALSR